VPFNATPSGIMSHVNGNILIVPTADGNIHVGPQHQLYRQLLQRYQDQKKRSVQGQQRSNRHFDDDNIKPTTAWTA
jgi:signal transduction protein with GAF and PtsI domain